ncbi:cobyric acid synthase [Tateyamaria pelophila]|uniref:cobyric acid synthase n=1 Tax=Tateyamaria pelophila TaxID=328415 RepID=UPI001CBFDED0|nr:cobyric acid synthase [Tateyamaria pelophila]
MSKSLMVQGTGSNVGKSMLVAGLCRAAVRRGVSVAPFKPQNMSNNAAVTADGGEIGRAQALQAMACGLAPHTDMNPVLLKPETDVGSQVVVQGKRIATVKARDYARMKPQLMASVLDSFNRLKSRYDLVLVEGAGSPAEVNLRPGDIANMGFARAADVPVILTGDIDRGGVIAQIVGTQAVIDPADAAMISGFIINRFRGDPTLFDDGYRMIEDQTGWRGFGVVPWFNDAWKLPAEDALDISTPNRNDGLHVVCLKLSRISNFDDLDPLAQEPGVRLTMLHAGQPLPADTDVVILPGSKSTRGDLAFIRAQGWDEDMRAHHRRGGHVLGICGGFQMLGHMVSDPDGIEGPAGTARGLGLLDIATVMTADKRLSETTAVHVPTGCGITGYEMHKGFSEGADRARPFARIGGQNEGALSEDGRVAGTYLHGMFRSDAFRRAWLAGFGTEAADTAYDKAVEDVLENLADWLEQHLNVDDLLASAR